MKYFVLREGREFGPYDADELRRYTGEGRISPSDGIREAGTSGRQFGSVHEVLGTLGAPSLHPGGPDPASPYAAPATWQSLERMPGGFQATPSGIPVPPSMQWWVLLLITFATCGIFAIVRMFTQANYAKKVDPANKSTLYYALYLVSAALNQALTIGGAAGGQKLESMPLILLSLALSFAGIAFILLGHFKLRASLEKAFGTPLSGVMTFFFNVFYFQYHMHRVATAMKAAGAP
ncbi:MAG: hypothetical protein IT186_11460 [Acidobacteria bacterium]|nr:hypothetical protein [Acidobacteriota bacterium]